MTFVSSSGIPIGQALKQLLQIAVQEVLKGAGKAMRQSLKFTTVNHIARRFPGSRHWNINKVADAETEMEGNKASGAVDINIPGASRARKDVVIVPVRARRLAIPVHMDSYGKSPSDFKGLFRIKESLYKREGGALLRLFALSTRAFQEKDETLLPSDDVYAQNAMTRISRILSEGAEKAVQQI